MKTLWDYYQEVDDKELILKCLYHSPTYLSAYRKEDQTTIGEIKTNAERFISEALRDLRQMKPSLPEDGRQYILVPHLKEGGNNKKWGIALVCKNEINSQSIRYYNYNWVAADIKLGFELYVPKTGDFNVYDLLVELYCNIRGYETQKDFMQLRSVPEDTEESRKFEDWAEKVLGFSKNKGSKEWNKLEEIIMQYNTLLKDQAVREMRDCTDEL